VTDAIDDAKDAVRHRVWQLLVDAGAAAPDSYGKIPDFREAANTASRLADLEGWKAAQVVKANPDAAQHAVRAQALRDRKLLYMAVPRMATLRPFYLLDPASTPAIDPDQATTKESAAQHALRISVDDMKPVDLVVCGSVAVSRNGARIGKGAGYSDLEFALLTTAGLITDATIIVAPVHQLQVIDEPLPETQHDFSVDVIITPAETIECPRRPRPPGIIWEHVSAEKISAIPALAAAARAAART
jgi:5-formyltetrahydrofolate cyclo-ligase